MFGKILLFKKKITQNLVMWPFITKVRSNTSNMHRTLQLNTFPPNRQKGEGFFFEGGGSGNIGPLKGGG